MSQAPDYRDDELNRPGEEAERAEPSPDDFDAGWEATDERAEPSPDDIAVSHELEAQAEERKRIKDSQQMQ